MVIIHGGKGNGRKDRMMECFFDVVLSCSLGLSLLHCMF